jgi:hypothetical protein
MAAGRNNASFTDIGNGVIIAGLVLQLLWFIFFLVVAIIFHRRMNLAPTPAARQPEIRWRSYLRTLYFVSTLIVIRSLFRVIEYVQGNTGYIMKHEAFLYFFDSLPMLFVVVYLHWKHPGEIGVLLRGQPAVTNGFKLISTKSDF